MYDDDDDDDISILSAKPANLPRMEYSKPKIHVLFDKYYEDNQKAAFDGKGSSKKNPILVENYLDDDDDLQLAIIASLSSLQENTNSRKSKRKLNFVTEDARKMFKGESSNSKPNDAVIDTKVVDRTTFLCDICVDEKPISAIFRILGCNHSYCSDCIAKYVASKLQENINNISCPVMGCKGKLDPQHCSSILPRQVFDRWGDALCEAMILASEKFYCPFKDCSALLINEYLSVGRGVKVLESECPDCHRLFCAQCKVAWHSEVSSCEEFQKLNKDEREREDILMMKLAKSKRWNRCPHCGFYVEKIGGCSSVHCRNCSSTFIYR